MTPDKYKPYTIEELEDNLRKGVKPKFSLRRLRYGIGAWLVRIFVKIIGWFYEVKKRPANKTDPSKGHIIAIEGMTYTIEFWDEELRFNSKNMVISAEGAKQRYCS